MCALRGVAGCVGLPEVVVTSESALLFLAVPIQAGVITGAIIGAVLGLLLLIVVIYYLMRFLVARRVFSLSVRSVDGLWPASFCQWCRCQGVAMMTEPFSGTDTAMLSLKAPPSCWQRLEVKFRQRWRLASLRLVKLQQEMLNKRGWSSPPVHPFCSLSRLNVLSLGGVRSRQTVLPCNHCSRDRLHILTLSFSCSLQQTRQEKERGITAETGKCALLAPPHPLLFLLYVTHIPSRAFMQLVSYRLISETFCH